MFFTDFLERVFAAKQFQSCLLRSQSNTKQPRTAFTNHQAFRVVKQWYRCSHSSSKLKLSITGHLFCLKLWSQVRHDYDTTMTLRFRYDFATSAECRTSVVRHSCDKMAMNIVFNLFLSVILSL